MVDVPQPAAVVARATGEGLTWEDLGLTPLWRTFGDRDGEPRPGTSRRLGDSLVWSVTPGEWTVMGPRPDDPAAVDLSHVRGLFRLAGERSTELVSRFCSLDLGDSMFPDGAAARTLVAGVATEIVRADQEKKHSFLILPSRSFSRYLTEVVLDAGAEFGLAAED